jgi:hypothetical protein
MIIHDLKHPNESMAASLKILQRKTESIAANLDAYKKDCSLVISQMTDLVSQLKSSLIKEDPESDGEHSEESDCEEFEGPIKLPHNT